MPTQSTNMQQITSNDIQIKKIQKSATYERMNGWTNVCTYITMKKPVRGIKWVTQPTQIFRKSLIFFAFFLSFYKHEMNICLCALRMHNQCIWAENPFSKQFLNKNTALVTPWLPSLAQISVRCHIVPTNL